MAMRLIRKSGFALLSVWAGIWLAHTAYAKPQYAIAMHGEPALPEHFTSLPYANPDAPQGGTLRQAILGSFDSVSPFILKGTAAYGVRTYVYESLMARNGDEAFSLYGLLAETIDIADDRSHFTFKLRPEARFSDGQPVTAEDVAFSLNLLRDKGRPNYKNSYGKISRVETPDPLTVIFYQAEADMELPLIIGLMPILPKHDWQNRDFGKTTFVPPVGSGPYVISEVKPGESILYRKNPTYWGANLPLNKGLWNFDVLKFDYYRDANAAFEAFKKGDADVRIETDPVRWKTGYDFPAVAQGKVLLEKVPQLTPAPATGFVFNTRKPLFADRLVREALLLAFDFEWANSNLFSHLYQRTYGYYSGSKLSSLNQPATQLDQSLLKQSSQSLRQDFMSGQYRIPVSDGTGHDRKNLTTALALLAQAGWHIRDTQLVNDQGQAFEFTITLNGPDQEKIALHYQRTLQLIGITAHVRSVDASQFQLLLRKFDYDMVPVTWFNSLSPGNEQKSYFASDQRDVEGSRNYPGIADKAVDKAIEALLRPANDEEFTETVRALDRLLVSGFYMIPFYNSGGQWVARWNRIGRPEHQPLTGFETTTLWAQ